MEFVIEYSWAIAMIVALIVGVFTGYPVAFLLCGLGIVFALLSSRRVGAVRSAARDHHGGKHWHCRRIGHAAWGDRVASDDPSRL